MDEQKAYLFSQEYETKEDPDRPDIIGWYFLFPDFIKRYGICPFLKSQGKESSVWRDVWLDSNDSKADLDQAVAALVHSKKHKEIEQALMEERKQFSELLRKDPDHAQKWEAVFVGVAAYQATKVKNSTAIDLWKQCLAGPVQELYQHGFDVHRCYRCVTGADLPKAKSQMAKSVGKKDLKNIAEHGYLQIGALNISGLQKRLLREQDTIKQNLKQAMNRLSQIWDDPHYPWRSPRYENLQWKKLLLSSKRERYTEAYFYQQAKTLLNGIPLSISFPDYLERFQNSEPDLATSFWNKQDGLFQIFDNDTGQIISLTDTKHANEAHAKLLQQEPEVKKTRKPRVKKDIATDSTESVNKKKRNTRDVACTGIEVTTKAEERLWNLCIIALAERSQSSHISLHDLIISTLYAYNGTIYQASEDLYKHTKKIFKNMIQTLERNQVDEIKDTIA